MGKNPRREGMVDASNYMIQPILMGSSLLLISFTIRLNLTPLPVQKCILISRWENKHKYLEVLASAEPRCWTCSAEQGLRFWSLFKSVLLLCIWCPCMFHAAGICELPSPPLQRGELSEVLVQGKSRGQRGWSHLPRVSPAEPALLRCGWGPWPLDGALIPFVGRGKCAGIPALCRAYLGTSFQRSSCSALKGGSSSVIWALHEMAGFEW